MSDCPHGERMRFCHQCIEEIFARVMVAVMRCEIPTQDGPGVTVADVREILENEVKKARRT